MGYASCFEDNQERQDSAVDLRCWPRTHQIVTRSSGTLPMAAAVGAEPPPPYRDRDPGMPRADSQETAADTSR
jgi:hypothetical protein